MPNQSHGHCASCPHEWCPKMLREKLCAQQTHIPTGELETVTRAYIGELIRILDLHRPLGPDGKHGERHTDTCGCHPDDKPPAVNVQVCQLYRREGAVQDAYNYNPYTAVRRPEYSTLGDAYRMCQQDPEAFAAGAQYVLDRLNSVSGPINDMSSGIAVYLTNWSAEMLRRALKGEPQ